MFIYEKNASIYSWNGERKDLAEEYRNNLRGPFSPELQKILDRMRTSPLTNRYALRVIVPFRKFALVKLSGSRGVPPSDIQGVTYNSISEAEWDIFARRWEDITGVAL